jgi:hypothetical protein
MNFTMDSVPNYEEFTVLYDQYKIRKVKVALRPTRRVNAAVYEITNWNSGTGIVTGNTAATAEYPEVWSVLDYDDDTTQPISELQQYQSLRITRAYSHHKRLLRPKFAQMIFEGLTSTAYGARTGWIDCNNPDVLHYGFKYNFVNPNNTAAAVYVGTLEVTYYLAFKNVR